MSLRDDIVAAINRNSTENGSHTPDYILANYLATCLAAFDKATRARDRWHGFEPWKDADMGEPEATR